MLSFPFFLALKIAFFGSERRLLYPLYAYQHHICPPSKITHTNKAHSLPILSLSEAVSASIAECLACHRARLKTTTDQRPVPRHMVLGSQSRLPTLPP